jgi:hypothetical protein
MFFSFQRQVFYRRANGSEIRRRRNCFFIEIDCLKRTPPKNKLWRTVLPAVFGGMSPQKVLPEFCTPARKI